MATNVGINVAVTSSGTQQVTVQLQQMGAAATSSASAIDQINMALKGLALGSILSQLKNYVDGWANVDGMVRTATKSQLEANTVMDQVFDIAQKTRQPLSDVASVYQKMAIQASGLGLSQQEVLNVTEALGKALVVQHTSATQASGALLQFSQALGTGKVRAAEWNSIMTGLPVLAKAVADQMGTSTAGLKAMVNQGKLTSQALAEAVLKANLALTDQFNKSAHTIGQSFTVLNNAVTEYVGKLSDSLNASNMFGSAMLFLATNIDSVARTLAVAGVAIATFALLNGGLVTILTAARDAVLMLNAALFANPFALVATLIVAAVTALYLFRDAIVINQKEGLTLGDYMVSAWHMITGAVSGAWDTISKIWADFKAVGATLMNDIVGNASTTLPKLGTVVYSVVSTMISYFVGFYNSIGTIWNHFPEYFAGLFILAYNKAGEYTTTFANGIIDVINKIGDKVNLHIDPVAFVPVKDQFQDLTDGVAANFKQAFATDYLGKFTASLTAGAKDAAALRNPLKEVADLTQKTKPIDILGKVKPDRELEKIKNALRAMLNTVDPAAGAILDMQKDFDTLDAALRRHLITGEEHEKYMAAVVLHYKDIINPQAAYLRQLNQETNLLGLDGDARTVMQKSLEQELAMRKKSMPLSQEEVNVMRQSIQANLDANAVASQRANILSSQVQPQKDYNDSITAANQLFANGQITAEQYHDAMLKINVAFMDTQKTLDSGFASGFLSVQQDMENFHDAGKTLVTDTFDGFNDAMAKFVTTGKLNFSSLVSSILADMVKIELKILASQALQSLFGASSGFSAYGALTGNSIGTSTTQIAGASSSVGTNVSSNTTGLFGLSGYASGGYTGSNATDQVAGVVHGQEFVVNATATAQPGVREYLEALNAGTTSASTTAATHTATASASTANTSVVIQPVINNNASDKVAATVSQGTDSNGQPNFTVMIDTLENSLAARVKSGRGKLNNAIGSAFNLPSAPSRS